MARAVGHFNWSLELHRKLLADHVRNRAFQQALHAFVRPGVTVSDIGAGTGVQLLPAFHLLSQLCSGLLSFMASKLGAKRCLLYEADEEVSKLSQKIGKRSKITGCEYIAQHSSDVAIPPLTDIVISETLGCYALEEHLVENMEDAKRFLVKGGALIPNRLEQFVAPVISDRCWNTINSWDGAGKEFEVDFSVAKSLSMSQMFQMTIKSTELLDGISSKRRWDVIDFTKRNTPHRVARGITWPARAKEYQVYGFCVWWMAQLAPDVILTTSPDGTTTHWEQAFLPLERHLHVYPREILLLDIESNSDKIHGGTRVKWNAYTEKETKKGDKHRNV